MTSVSMHHRTSPPTVRIGDYGDLEGHNGQYYLHIDCGHDEISIHGLTLRQILDLAELIQAAAQAKDTRRLQELEPVGEPSF